MNTTESIVATVEGPNGTALVVEVPAADGKAMSYEVRLQGTTEAFPSMGEAYITAKEKAGVKN